MILWTLNPSYLDDTSLFLLWHDAVTAKNIIKSNKARYYKDHPEIKKFLQSPMPIDEINEYLLHIYDEAHFRNIELDASLLESTSLEFTATLPIEVSNEQLSKEYKRLLDILKNDNRARYNELIKNLENPLFVPAPHPLFITE